MKYFVLLFFIAMVCNPVFAGAWNRYPYQSMSNTTYRDNYTRQVNYKPTPYAQQRYGYSYNNNNYSSYTNSMNTYNINRMSRGMNR